LAFIVVRIKQGYLLTDGGDTIVADFRACRVPTVSVGEVFSPVVKLAKCDEVSKPACRGPGLRVGRQAIRARYIVYLVLDNANSLKLDFVKIFNLIRI